MTGFQVNCLHSEKYHNVLINSAAQKHHNQCQLALCHFFAVPEVTALEFALFYGVHLEISSSLKEGEFLANC